MSNAQKNVNIGGNTYQKPNKNQYTNAINNNKSSFYPKQAPNLVNKNKLYSQNQNNNNMNQNIPKESQNSFYSTQSIKNKNNNNKNINQKRPPNTNIKNNNINLNNTTHNNNNKNNINLNNTIHNNNNKNNINLNNTTQTFNKKQNPNQNTINNTNAKKFNKNTFYKSNTTRNSNTYFKIPNNNNTLTNFTNTNNINNNANNNNNINNNIINNNEIFDDKIKNYIIYLKSHLNSSYYANNDLNNEYNKIINKSKQINDSINNNHEKLISMNKLYEENLEKNKNYKKEYINLVDKYKINYLNEQNKLKELNQMISVQDNDILKLENENNILNEDINNKQIIIDDLKRKINILKNKKNIIEANNEYLFLFKKKNILISLNEKMKKMKKIKSKNDELLKSMNGLKNDLQEKENIIIQSQNIQNELSNKLNQLANEEEIENENTNMDEKNHNNIIYKSLDFNTNINNNMNINTSYEKDNKGFDNEMENGLYRTYNKQFGNNFNKDENEENNDLIDYQELIGQENKKEEKINEKLNIYENEISKLKKEIFEIKSKNNEDLALLNQYINNLSPNDEEIKNNLILNKKNILNQKESLIKYNKKFRESLSEKNDLKNKINQLKIENEKIELKLTEKQKTIGFKIKAIKIRRDGKNKNGKGMERNLSDPDLIKNNNNDRLYISQNREHFIPVEDIYRYKKFEYRYRNEKKLLNKFKSRKSSSFDNIFKYNANNKIEQESNIDILNTPRGGAYLYTIDKEGKFLGYGINLKKYVYINTSSIKGWKLFFKEYKNNANGSLLLNTLAGLFILTGENHNHLYYYSQSKNIIYLIMILKYNHKYGGLILTKDNNKIIILGGIYTNEVELFNIQKNALKKLPNLLSKRINSSYNIINNQFLFAFFGKNNNKIEFLDLKNPYHWINFDYKSNNNIQELSGHIGFHVNENVVIIVGGENNDKIMVFYFKEKFIDVTDFILSFDTDCGIDELIFDKEKCFNIVENKEKNSIDGNSTKEIMGMDNFGNVHCFDNDYSYTIYVF